LRKSLLRVPYRSFHDTRRDELIEMLKHHDQVPQWDEPDMPADLIEAAKLLPRVLDRMKYGANESSFMMVEKTLRSLGRDISRRQWCIKRIRQSFCSVSALSETVSALEWRCPRREPRTDLASQAVI
jgi:hypothetical protein